MSQLFSETTVSELNQDPINNWDSDWAHHFKYSKIFLQENQYKFIHFKIGKNLKILNGKLLLVLCTAW